ncbi:inositol monophosphatase family protein [Flavimaricola marinus]|uniref:Inositol-1-monophosphatase n=1 Tax=Flavimaricola marinus TaxID=1819565 RepID=A0A238LEC0_9RHOB|nr:inositol monophosphatase [Flavimaricola marinus]SMY07306.1 Inositol-1-monophosphatase [Flavimaricola marinus]
MLDKRLEAALEMAKEAGALAQRMRANPGELQAEIKGPMDLVTAADVAVETLLRDRILTFEPDVAILGEEDGLEGVGRRIWIIDPIDGTVNFSRGMPDWAISIAFSDGVAITHGVIYAPDLGLTATAIRGQGCYLNGQRVLFDETPSDTPIVALGYSARRPIAGYLGRIERLIDHGIEHRRHGAATICLLGVLGRWFDAFYEPALNIWDAAAGLLMIEEAGGHVSHDPLPDFLTKPSDVLARNRLDLKLGSILAGDD